MQGTDSGYIISPAAPSGGASSRRDRRRLVGAPPVGGAGGPAPAPDAMPCTPTRRASTARCTMGTRAGLSWAACINTCAPCIIICADCVSASTPPPMGPPPPLDASWRSIPVAPGDSAIMGDPLPIPRPGGGNLVSSAIPLSPPSPVGSSPPHPITEVGRRTLLGSVFAMGIVVRRSNHAYPGPSSCRRAFCRAS